MPGEESKKKLHKAQNVRAVNSHSSNHKKTVKVVRKVDTENDVAYIPKLYTTFHVKENATKNDKNIEYNMLKLLELVLTNSDTEVAEILKHDYPKMQPKDTVAMILKKYASLHKDDYENVEKAPYIQMEEIKVTLKPAEICNIYFDETKDVKKKFGVYDVLKRAALKSIANVNAKSIAESSMFGNSDSTINRKFLDDITDLLNSGEQWNRGSSKEYKEMKREVEKLKKFCNQKDLSNVQKKYVKIMLKALGKKAHMYCKEREKSEISENINSYKGKRISIMRQISKRLYAVANNFEDVNGEYFVPEEKEAYKKLIKNKFESMSFNPVLYRDIYVYFNPKYDKELSHERMILNEGNYIGQKYYGKKFTVNDMNKLQDKINDFYFEVATFLDSPSDDNGEHAAENAAAMRDDLKLFIKDEYVKNPALFKKNIKFFNNRIDFGSITDGKITGIPGIDKRMLTVAGNAAADTAYALYNPGKEDEKGNIIDDPSWKLNDIRKLEYEACQGGYEERVARRKAEHEASNNNKQEILTEIINGVSVNLDEALKEEDINTALKEKAAKEENINTDQKKKIVEGYPTDEDILGENAFKIDDYLALKKEEDKVNENSKKLSKKVSGKEENPVLGG